MARREPKSVPVMVRLEASLHAILIEVLEDLDDSGSTYFRELLIHELMKKGRLTHDQCVELLGA